MSNSADRIKAVIVGGSSGIGMATAKILFHNGYDLTIGSRSLEKLRSARSQIGEGVDAFVIDVANKDSVAAFFDKVGSFDHLIITASNALIGSFLDTDVEKAKSFFECKFWGQYQVAKRAAVSISNEGSITLFSGAASQKASPGFSVGSVINAAIENLTRTLARELAPIRINTVSPGVVDTPIWGEITANDAERQGMLEQAAAVLPLGRVGQPDEIAHTVQYLIENRYTTGATIFVDGGFLLI